MDAPVTPPRPGIRAAERGMNEDVDMGKTGIACIALLALCLGASCHPQPARVSGSLFRGPINAAWDSSRSLVLIVPTNEADEAIEQKIHDYVRGVQKFIIEKKLPDHQARVVTDTEALQADLSQSCVAVYGTPRGNLWLARHIAALPVAIEPDGIVTDRRCEGSNLRFISAWPHPQNPKLGMVIYTAQRAEDIIGINTVTHGMTDYVAAQGQTARRAGNYFGKTGHWTLHPDLPEALEDLDFLFKTIEQVHPNCRANLSKADYAALKARAQEALTRACDDGGEVPIAVLALTAAEATAAIGDGHTACHLPEGLADPRDPTPCMPPFRLRWDVGHVVIDETIGGLEHLAGACVVQVNGRPFEQTMAPVLVHVSGERQAFRMVRFLSQQEDYWALIRPIRGLEMTVTIRRGRDEPQTVKVPLISLSRYRRELPAVRRIYLAGFHEFHHDGRTCYWRYDGFQASDAAYKAIDAVFEDIREHGAQTLVIDLRFNGGGNSKAAEYILDYLTSKPYRVYSRVDTKVSRQFLQVQRLGILGPLARLFQGHVVALGVPRRRPRNVEYRFGGSVYALIGPRTFSTASDFAHALKDFHIAALVGEETGGLRSCFGDCPGFVMPHSGLRFSVSTKRFYAPIPKSGDALHGSLPNIPITDARLAPFLNADDPERAFVLDRVEKGSRADSAPRLPEAAADKRRAEKL
jgi:hypothetical protein